MPCCPGTNNVILRTLKNIDQKQKEVIIATDECISCDTSLLISSYNTIPVSIFMCDGSPLATFVNATDDRTTRLYRIEDVIDCEVVKLRLITTEGSDDSVAQVQRCTQQTCLCNISCICCIECFAPITCELCTQTTTIA